MGSGSRTNSRKGSHLERVRLISHKRSCKMVPVQQVSNKREGKSMSTLKVPGAQQSAGRAEGQRDCRFPWRTPRLPVPPCRVCEGTHGRAQRLLVPGWSTTFPERRTIHASIDLDSTKGTASPSASEAAQANPTGTAVVYSTQQYHQIWARAPEFFTEPARTLRRSHNVANGSWSLDPGFSS